MNRKLKNTIMIILVAVVCAAMVFTVYHAKEQAAASSGDMMMQAAGESAPPEKPEGDADTQSGENDGENSTGDTGNTPQTPPEKPDGEAPQQSQQPENSDQKAPSDISSGGENAAVQNDTAQNANGNSSSQDGAPAGEMPSMGMTAQMLSISPLYYILFGMEGLVLAFLIMYLIMSRLNKNTFRETFINRDKAIIYVLSIVILAAALTLACGIISGKLTGGGSQTPAGGQSADSVSYSAVREISEDTTIKSGKFISESEDENAILATGDITAKLSGITVTKSGDSAGGDGSSFYGNNSGIIAKDKAKLTLKKITVNTDADGANGIFSYGGSAETNNSSGDGTEVTVSDSAITTTGDNAGGIMTTGGGIMNAANLTIETAGVSSAAIRSDRGGGTVTVDGGTYTTTGAGSPAIYSTAEISVANAELIAKASEGIVIEGKNTVSIDSCRLTDSNTKLNGQSTTYKNIFLYQSMSGDAAEGTAEFSAKDSAITTNNGDTLYVTNTTAAINLENNTIENNDASGSFLRVQKDSWGNSGSNGGNVTLTMTKQKAIGNIVIDSISTLDMTMKSGSYYEGTLNGDNSAKSISLTLDKSSKIKLTGNSYVTSLDDADDDYGNIDFNGYKLYVNGRAVN